jgi:hypothetical protein
MYCYSSVKPRSGENQGERRKGSSAPTSEFLLTRVENDDKDFTDISNLLISQKLGAAAPRVMAA